MSAPWGEKFVLNLRELSGALRDLRTLLPLMLGEGPGGGAAHRRDHAGSRCAAVGG
jgi:hypothetical protein